MSAPKIVHPIQSKSILDSKMIWKFLKPNTPAIPNPTMTVLKQFFKDFLPGNLKALSTLIIQKAFVFSTENKPFYDTLDDIVST